MNINSSIRAYDVIFRQNFDFVREFFKIKNSIFVIDKNVYELYCNVFEGVENNKLLIIEAVEQNKTIDVALSICEKITEIAAKRNTTLISIGGGIVQDLTGFVANITYRGIHWIYVPTTLLAACDSCIGGKTSLNYKKYKNLLGTFYPPDEIYICSKWFVTLSERDYKSGLGEVLKFNLMKGSKGLNEIEINLPQLLEREYDIVNQFVKSSLEFKKTFIEVDEFDRGERIKLNFAHTFGHAIEVISEYKIPHGTSVAIGMIMANNISFNRGLISEKVIKEMESVLLKVISVDTELLQKPKEEYLSVIRKDKKQIAKSLTAVLISRYGEKSELSIVHDITEAEIDFAINYFIELYRAE